MNIQTIKELLAIHKEDSERGLAALNALADYCEESEQKYKLVHSLDSTFWF